MTSPLGSRSRYRPSYFASGVWASAREKSCWMRRACCGVKTPFLSMRSIGEGAPASGAVQHFTPVTDYIDTKGTFAPLFGALPF